MTMMKLLKKLKQLLNLNTPQDDAPKPISEPVLPDADSQMPTAKPNPSTLEHLPITSAIAEWLNQHGWQLEHRPSDAYGMMPSGVAQVHHLIVPFGDGGDEWTCVFRINEHTKLVSVFGVLTDVVPLSHYAPMMMAIAMANLGIPFGNLEMDPTDGEVRAKVSFDAEFTNLDDHTLDCYLQGVASLSELAQKLYHDVMSEQEPSPIVLDYLNTPFASNDTHDETSGQFFEPTQQYQ